MKADTVNLKSLLITYIWIFGIILCLSTFALLLSVHVLNLISYQEIVIFGQHTLNCSFLLYVIVGFIAQLIDGALGMAYGVTSTSFLISSGISPAVASSSVHAAEIFTTGISGFSHWRFKNLYKKLFIRLAIPGIIGSAIGAYVLSSFNGEMLKPFITCYLLFMGGKIVYKAFIKTKTAKILSKTFHTMLGLIGGFVDASGGGGWGPVVTTTLIGTG